MLRLRNNPQVNFFTFKKWGKVSFLSYVTVVVRLIPTYTLIHTLWLNTWHILYLNIIVIGSQHSNAIQLPWTHPQLPVHILYMLTSAMIFFFFLKFNTSLFRCLICMCDTFSTHTTLSIIYAEMQTFNSRSSVTSLSGKWLCLFLVSSPMVLQND